jgi:hypothetical protein
LPKFATGELAAARACEVLLFGQQNRAQRQEVSMFYTSMSLWFRAESLVEAGIIAAAVVLATAYSFALWRAARIAENPAITPRI